MHSFEYRRNTFSEYFKSRNLIDQYREDDQHHRSYEKLRQLDEYIDLQSRIDQIRCCINEPREAFRQRLLELEHQRLQLLAAEHQRLLEEEKAKAAAMIKPIEKKTPRRKGKKKTNMSKSFCLMTRYPPSQFFTSTQQVRRIDPFHILPILFLFF